MATNRIPEHKSLHRLAFEHYIRTGQRLTNAEWLADFLPAAEIIDVASSIEGLSPSLLPFGSDDYGNFICVGADDHRIYFWDHEIDSRP